MSPDIKIMGVTLSGQAITGSLNAHSYGTTALHILNAKALLYPQINRQARYLIGSYSMPMNLMDKAR